MKSNRAYRKIIIAYRRSSPAFENREFKTEVELSCTPLSYTDMMVLRFRTLFRGLCEGIESNLRRHIARLYFLRIDTGI